MKLVTPEQIREMDRRTIEEVGLPGLLLMERAALGATQALLKWLPKPPESPGGAKTAPRVVFLCGPGNNGGDGLAMARMVGARGFHPQIALLGAPESMREDAALNLQIARNLNLDIIDLSDEDPAQIHPRLASFCAGDGSHGPIVAWCDALLGTGIDRDIQGRYRAAIDYLNCGRADDHAPVFAVDIPSGLNAATGQVMGCAVMADATATFGFAKLGQTMYPARACCGDLTIVDIGIPAPISDAVGYAGDWLDQTWARSQLAPRPRDYHKGRSGAVLLLAGSHEKAGAAFLAARGALHSGAGLLTVGTHKAVVERVAMAVPEAMATTMLAHVPDGHCEERLREQVGRMDAVGMGPGIDTSDGTMQQLNALLDSEVNRLVLDADAITVLAKFDNYDALRDFSCRESTDSPRVVLTPHPGEMARLCRCRTQEVTDAPVQKALSLARETGCIVVLKTATTIIAGPDGRLAVNRSGNPGMSTGGVGDVLTGVITARLAEAAGGQGSTDAPSTFDIVCLAVFAHGMAGDRAAHALGERGMSAGDLAAALSHVWNDLEQ